MNYVIVTIFPNCKLAAPVSVSPINAHKLVKILIVFSYFFIQFDGKSNLAI